MPTRSVEMLRASGSRGNPQLFGIRNIGNMVRLAAVNLIY